MTPWPLEGTLRALLVLGEDLSPEEWAEKSGWPVEVIHALLNITEQELLLALDWEVFGIALTALRKDRGIPAKRLADIAGVAQWTIHRWEKGKSRPTPELLLYVLDVLRRKIDIRNKKPQK